MRFPASNHLTRVAQVSETQNFEPLDVLDLLQKGKVSETFAEFSFLLSKGKEVPAGQDFHDPSESACPPAESSRDRCLIPVHCIAVLGPLFAEPRFQVLAGWF